MPPSSVPVTSLRQSAQGSRPDAAHIGSRAPAQSGSAPEGYSTPSLPPTLTGAGSTYVAPFFALAFARYHQQHPAVTVNYSPARPGAGAGRGARGRCGSRAAACAEGEDDDRGGACT
jgi:phosphate transport system substrate-binding protein